MTKEVVVKESTALAKGGPAWGSEGIDASDVVIPKLLLMQGQSEFVAAGKVKAGDIVKSTTGDLLGGAAGGVEIIPFMTFKTWVLSEFSGSRYEFRGVEPITAENVNEPLEWNVGSKAWRRDRCLNFYVLLPADISKEMKALKKLEEKGELPDPGDALLPCVLSFRRTSYGAGKDLATHFMKAATFNVPPAVSKFKLLSKLEKNDQGTFYIFTIEPAGKSSEEEINACKKWYEVISHTKVKVDDSDLKKDKKAPAPKQEKARVIEKDVDMDVESVF